LGIVGVVATKQFTKWAPLIMWGLTAPATAAITAVARLSLSGNAQAMSSRYVTLSAAMWASAAVTLTATVLHFLRDTRLPMEDQVLSGGTERTRRVFRDVPAVRLVGVVATCLASVALVSQVGAWADWSHTRGIASLRNRAVLADDRLLTPEAKGTLSTDSKLVDQERPYLIRKRLTLFRNKAPVPSTTMPPSGSGSSGSGSSGSVSSGLLSGSTAPESTTFLLPTPTL
jgi:hypothetical protein